MRAFRMEAPRVGRIAEVPDAVAGAGEALLRAFRRDAEPAKRRARYG